MARKDLTVSDQLLALRARPSPLASSPSIAEPGDQDSLSHGLKSVRETIRTVLLLQPPLSDLDPAAQKRLADEAPDQHALALYADALMRAYPALEGLAGLSIDSEPSQASQAARWFWEIEGEIASLESKRQAMPTLWRYDLASRLKRLESGPLRQAAELLQQSPNSPLTQNALRARYAKERQWGKNLLGMLERLRTWGSGTLCHDLNKHYWGLTSQLQALEQIFQQPDLDLLAVTAELDSLSFRLHNAETWLKSVADTAWARSRLGGCGC